MTSQRLTRPHALSPSQARRLEQFEFRGRRPLPLFEAMAHSPAALEDLATGTECSISRSTLPLRQREILILRTLARWNARAEWDVHLVLYMSVAPLSLAEVERLGGGSNFIAWSAEERLLIDVADCLRDRAELPDNLWSALSFLFSAEQCAEIVMIATQYIKIALMTRVLAIPSQQPAGPGIAFSKEVSP